MEKIAEAYYMDPSPPILKKVKECLKADLWAIKEHLPQIH